MEPFEHEIKLIYTYHDVFNNDDGLAVLNDLKKQAYMNVSSHSESHITMARIEGQRDLIRYIEYQLSINPIEREKELREEGENNV